MPVMTEKQYAAWPDAVARARTAGADGIQEADYAWKYHWEDESRPGRGHYLSALWTDGEHFVQITMDVYGYPTVSVAELVWVHSDALEECDCALCRDPESQDSKTGDPE